MSDIVKDLNDKIGSDPSLDIVLMRAIECIESATIEIRELRQFITQWADAADLHDTNPSDNTWEEFRNAHTTLRKVVSR